MSGQSFYYDFRKAGHKKAGVIPLLGFAAADHTNKTTTLVSCDLPG